MPKGIKRMSTEQVVQMATAAPVTAGTVTAGTYVWVSGVLEPTILLMTFFLLLAQCVAWVIRGMNAWKKRRDQTRRAGDG